VFACPISISTVRGYSDVGAALPAITLDAAPFHDGGSLPYRRFQEDV
jgi:hypothetical protein